MTRTLTIGVIAAALAATPAAADGVQPLITGVTRQADGITQVNVSFLNTGAAARFEPPARLSATVGGATARAPVVLERTGAAGAVDLAAGSFVRQRYTTAAIDGGSSGAVLTLAGGAGFALPGVPASETKIAGSPVVVETTLDSPTADTGNEFLGKLSAYAPIYAVYGPGTTTDAKLQISFKYQLFGREKASWLDGINFAYTQRLFWDLGQRSSPFRNVDYNPELIYIVPAPVKLAGLAVGGQAGVMHMSNGRDGEASRSFNAVYVQPVATLPLGDLTLTVGPRLLTYFGDLGDNPDIARYRGRTGLFAQLGTDDGWRVSTTTRLNIGSGKGALDVEASYPLNRLVGGLNLYAFGQAFTGYGENLLDYDRRQTRVRVGLGFVR